MCHRRRRLRISTPWRDRTGRVSIGHMEWLTMETLRIIDSRSKLNSRPTSTSTTSLRAACLQITRSVLTQDTNTWCWAQGRPRASIHPCTSRHSLWAHRERWPQSCRFKIRQKCSSNTCSSRHPPTGSNRRAATSEITTYLKTYQLTWCPSRG